MSTTQQEEWSANAQAYNRILFPDHRDARDRTRKVFSNDLFRQKAINTSVSKQMPFVEQRELNLTRLQTLCDANLFDVEEFRTVPTKWLAVIEENYCDDAAAVMKYSVQYNLFTAAITLLGSEKHQEFMKGGQTLKYPGAFCMTEIGHGSNVAALETEVRVDTDTKEFVLHSPTVTSHKFWIGNAATHARYGVVFARLILPDGDYGVHCFLVPLRTNKMELMPGVHIEDCGLKGGLNSLDNGRIWFDQVRIPISALLDKYFQVDLQTFKYSSPLPSAGARFAAVASALLIARLSVAVGALLAARSGLTIAIRYAFARRQFNMATVPSKSKSGKQEAAAAESDRAVPQEDILMDYTIHQQRLLIPLTQVYAIVAYAQVAKSIYEKDIQSAQAHLHSAALKVLSTQFTLEALQSSRECCGGHGYLARNLLTSLRADADSFVTLDGDNFVLLQQVARILLKDYQKSMKKQGALAAVGVLLRQWGVSDKYQSSVSYDSSDSTLSSPDFLLHCMKARQFRELETLALRLRSLGGSRGWNQCQPHAVAAARAFLDLMCVDSFTKLVATAPVQHRTILQQVLTVFGLTRITSDPWFVCNIITKVQWKKCRSLVEKLLNEQIRPNALDLVGGLGVPEYQLKFTIGRADGDYVATFAQSNL